MGKTQMSIQDGAAANYKSFVYLTFRVDNEMPIKGVSLGRVSF